MSRASDLITQVDEVVRRRRVDKRRGRKRNLVKLTFRSLAQSTQSIRPQQNAKGRTEFVSVNPVPRNKQLIFKMTTTAMTPGRGAYNQTLIFHKIDFNDRLADKYPLKVSTKDGSFVYAGKLSGAETPVSVRCNCEDFYYMWWYHDNQKKALAGPKMKPYVRKTPPPPEGYPYRNPGEVPGVCKHCIGAFEDLIKKRLLTR